MLMEISILVGVGGMGLFLIFPSAKKERSEKNISNSRLILSNFLSLLSDAVKLFAASDKGKENY